MIENQKKVWITGASSGIGKAVAEKFAKENWKVAISARREELLNEMAKNKPEIRGQWARYKEQQAKYHDLSGKERKVSFDGLM